MCLQWQNALNNQRSQIAWQSRQRWWDACHAIVDIWRHTSQWWVSGKHHLKRDEQWPFNIRGILLECFYKWNWWWIPWLMHLYWRHSRSSPLQREVGYLVKMNLCRKSPNGYWFYTNTLYLNTTRQSLVDKRLLPNSKLWDVTPNGQILFNFSLDSPKSNI